MLSFRNEPGIKGIRLCWYEEPWADKQIKIELHTPAYKNAKPFRFCIEVQWGPGAGYKNGATAFFAVNCKDKRHGKSIYCRTPLQVGVTKNGNKVPYCY